MMRVRAALYFDFVRTGPDSFYRWRNMVMLNLNELLIAGTTSDLGDRHNALGKLLHRIAATDSILKIETSYRRVIGVAEEPRSDVIRSIPAFDFKIGVAVTECSCCWIGAKDLFPQVEAF